MFLGGNMSECVNILWTRKEKRVAQLQEVQGKQLVL